MKNIALRRKFIEMIATLLEDYGSPPIIGWVEGLLAIENKGLTQREISDKLSEILNDDRFATSLTSVNRALKSMERGKLIIKKGSRKSGFIYNFNTLSGVPIGLFQKMLSVNTKQLINLRNFKNQIIEIDDKSLLNGIEIHLTFSQTMIKFSQQILDNIKDSQ